LPGGTKKGEGVEMFKKVSVIVHLESSV